LTIDELRLYKSLSNKAYNLCSANSLRHIDDIIDFYEKHKDFKLLRSCGVKTNTELISLVRDYKPEVRKTKEANELSVVTLHIRKNSLKANLLMQESNLLIEKLSVRAKNCIYSLTNSEKIDCWEFIGITEKPGFSFLDIRNAGEKTVKELIKFKTKLTDLIVKIGNQSIMPEDLICSELSKCLDYNFNDDYNFRKDLENKEIDLLFFVDNFILNSTQISIREKLIIIYLLKYNKETEASNYYALALKIGLSRERARQCVVEMKITFSKKFPYLKKLLKYCYRHNEFMAFGYWPIQSEKVHNSKNLVNIERNEKTLSRLLNLMDLDDHFIINDKIEFQSELGPVPYNKTAYLKERYFKLDYLVNKEFIKEEKLLGILQRVYNILIDRIPDDYFLNINDEDLNNDQKEFLIEIITNNFELKSIDKQIFIERNTLITATEIIYQIIEEENDLMTAEDIHEEYLKRFPDSSKPLSSIRSALGKDCFIYFRGNGPSRYGLKDWQEERGLIPGSIKGICQDFISKNDNPVHLFELEQHVIKLRDTNIKNISTNLKLDKNSKYIFYPGGFVGLSDKKYSNRLISSYKNPTPQDANTICSFIKNHWYYDYEKLINKFTQEFELKPIQVKHIVHMKCAESILRLKDDKVYYNMMEEDSLINNLFNSSSSFKIQGFNPYKVDLWKYRLLCRLIITTENSISLDNSHLEFNKYDLDKSDICSVLFYHKSFKSINAFLWRPSEIQDFSDSLRFSFSDEKNLKTEKISDSLFLHTFYLEQNSSFQLTIRNMLESNENIDNLYDISVYNIDGMRKMEAFSEIIYRTEQLTRKAIDLSEAERIYNLIKARN
jgi:hypothetical protein